MASPKSSTQKIYVAKCRRIAILNCKGGVGKTTIAVNLAASLAHNLNKRVLLVDLDAQSNASIWLMGLPRWSPLDGMPEKTVCAFLHGRYLSDAVCEAVIEDAQKLKLCPNLDLIPAMYELTDLDHDYQDKPNNPYYADFYKLLEPLYEKYDYVIFDCPPSVGRATKCAVFSAHEIYVPANADFLSNVGLRLLENKLSKFEKESEEAARNLSRFRRSEIRGVIINDYDPRAKLDHPLSTIRARLVQLRSAPVVSDDADILDLKIPHSIEATRSIDRYLPSALDPKGEKMAEAFLKLSRYIDKTPLKWRTRQNEYSSKS